MKTKKFAAFLLALAMCFSLAVPAFATETGTLTTEIERMLPELVMTLPDASTIILNPYRMKYTQQSGSAAVPGIDDGDRFQIMNAVFSVLSSTLAKVHVSATVSGAVSGNAEFSTTAVDPGDTGHKVYLTLTHQTRRSDSPDIPVAGSSNPVVVISDAEQTLEWDLPAASANTGSSTVVPERIDMQFGGTCSDSPDENPWAESDTVSASLVFEVIPVTDIPMIALTYTSKSSSADDLTFEIPAPTDIKTSAPNYTLSEVKVGTSSSAAATATATTLTAANDKWEAITDGTKVTLSGSTFCASGKPLWNDTTAAVKKYALVTLTYTASDDSTKTLQYELKVTVVGHGT
jgi:hypothetical protein